MARWIRKGRINKAALAPFCWQLKKRSNFFKSKQSMECSIQHRCPSTSAPAEDGVLVRQEDGDPECGYLRVDVWIEGLCFDESATGSPGEQTTNPDQSVMVGARQRGCVRFRNSNESDGDGETYLRPSRTREAARAGILTLGSEGEANHPSRSIRHGTRRGLGTIRSGNDGDRDG